jgi:sterol desaturase/sphingolipid hydroxylase (fatty acid hydroxylase superfamily)
MFAFAISSSKLLNSGHLGLFTQIPEPAIAGVLAFLVLDLYMYLWHRSMHVIPLAWRFHRLHHTDRSMNVSTAYRFHPIEIISSIVPKLALIWWLAIPSNFVVIYELVFTVVIAVHHSNLNLPASLDRILALVILTPNYHRIHHSQVVSETNSNYASVLIWWDRLFGTHKSRPDLGNIQLGIADETRELNIWQSLSQPLIRD